MAAPKYHKGFTGNVVLVVESSWNTLAGSGQVAIPMESETLMATPKFIENDVKIGNTHTRKANTLDVEDIAGTVVSRLDYNNMGRILTQAIGTPTSTTYSPAEEITNSTSLIIDRTVDRLQYTGGVIEELRIMGNVADNVCKIEADWVFAKRTRSTDAILSASLTASTYALMSEMALRIGDIGDALAAGDTIGVNDFTLRIKHNLDLVRTSGSAYLIAPIRKIPRETSLEFTLPYLSDTGVSATIAAAIRAHSILQATLTWDGPGSDAITISLAEMYSQEHDNLNIPDSNTVPFKVKLNAYKNVLNTTLMATVAEEMLLVTAT